EYHGSKLEYNIIAIDYNNKENNLTNKLIISINDINDHGPKFDQDYYSINISKSIRPDTIIFQINATSKDLIENGNITYDLINSSDYFFINQQTGIIRLKKYLSSTITNFTLIIKAFENDINLTDYTNLFITIINDDNMYFNINNNNNNCFIEENKIIDTNICTIGFNSNDFIYKLIDHMNCFAIYENNGTIINKKIFDYEIDQHEYNVTIIVKDRENQSIILYSLNLTIYIDNINDDYPEFLTKNFTTVLYLFYLSINTIIHTMEIINNDQLNLNFEILNDTYSSYKLQSSLKNFTEIILINSIITDHEDNLIIRLSNNNNNNNNTYLSSYYIDLYIHLI
ncbi:unnamed protein product, partial [Rotaria sordida]